MCYKIVERKSKGQHKNYHSSTEKDPSQPNLENPYSVLEPFLALLTSGLDVIAS